MASAFPADEVYASTWTSHDACDQLWEMGMAADAEKHAMPGSGVKRHFGRGSYEGNASFVGVASVVDAASAVVAASFVGADAA